MKNNSLINSIIPHLFIFLFILFSYSSGAVEGFYKDVFMDGGAHLSNKTELYAADYVGLSYEYIATDSEPKTLEVMAENSNDDNGSLLYPDNEPRFRAIYTNGGKASSHGTALGETGRNRVRSFYFNGGSYAGSCAGAFIVSTLLSSYYQIWPGKSQSTGLSSGYTGHFIEDNSPLLNYYDFGGDQYIDDIQHLGGCYAGYEGDPGSWPEGTEVLARYDYSQISDMHQKPSIWAYKTDSVSGRLVVVGSHPEYETSGEGRDCMAAMLLYGIDGLGVVSAKAELSNGVVRTMNDNNTAGFEKIGDKQYHHFTVNLDRMTSDMDVVLDGDDNYDMHLFVAKDTFAFAGSADYADTGSGGNKTLTITSLPAGTWYVGVKCASTVTVQLQSWGHEYTGNLDVLNGLAYTIKADWSPTAIASNTLTSVPQLFDMSVQKQQSGLTFVIGVEKPCNYTLSLYTIAGRKLWSHEGYNTSTGYHTIEVEFRDLHLAKGFLVAVLKRPDRQVTKKILLNR